MPTKNFNLPQVAADQAQKHIPVNWSLDLIDAALGGVVVSATTATPPASPVLGAAYIVPTGSTFGTVAAGNVAVWSAGAWHGFAPPIGARVLVADEGRERIRTAAGWLPGQVCGALTGAALGLEVIDRFVNLTGGTVTVSGLIPTGVIVKGVSSWTVQAVTGATSYSVGVSGETGKFGSGLGVAVGSKNVGLVGPYATYSAANVLITSSGGAFTGGRVGLALYIERPSLPVA